MERDGVCCWPGCGRTDFLQSHHRIEWPDGGRTDADEMEMFCPTHHSFVHDNDIRIEGRPGGELRFFRPDGSAIVAGCGPLDPPVKEWLDRELFGPLIPVTERASQPVAEVAARPP